ncbi:MAG: phosphoglucomutase/phosphomannomutase family protein, partial [Cryomorphaceae bacterium]|nr:phosphoglucomutase/phosphomannomutase family protein [Cryomorphaceae bacterium]
MAQNIKFGTDGWRAIIAQDFTVENVARVTEATGIWLNKHFENPSVVIGHDCRFAGELFMHTAAAVLVQQGIKVYIAQGFVSTPMISLGAHKHGCEIGIILTASHNPPSYNGFKLKAKFGGPLQPEKINEIEAIIPDVCRVDYASFSVENALKSGLIEVLPLEKEYIDHVKASFDLPAIQASGLRLMYDAMYGAGQRVIPQVLPATTLMHCEPNPSFMGQAPEPIGKNLQELAQYIKTHQNIDCALATDGDADRIGLYDSHGEFIDSHHIILLLIHYLVKYKGMSGKVAIAFSVTPRVYTMCEHYGLEHTTTKIGFKDIAAIMVKEDVLLGGEESGGIAVKGHIPERDGIWMGLILWEFMAKSGKTLDELIEEVYEIVGPFKFERNDLHITEELKQKIIKNCQENNYNSFGKYTVRDVKTTDGFKYFFDDDRWVMIRPSGTEPVLRTYAEAPT